MIDTRPDDKCGLCHGTGTITDYVPYGNGSVPMELTCDCMLEDDDVKEVSDDSPDIQTVPH